MSYTDPSDGSHANPFEGTPLGGTPHWLARGQNHHTVRNVVLGAAASAVLGGAMTYHQTGDRQKAIQAAKLHLACYFALGPFILAIGFASFFCLDALMAGDFAFALVLGLIVVLSGLAFVCIFRHFTRRLRSLVALPLP
jgi:hypothetical protein